MSDPFAPTQEDQLQAIEWLGSPRMDVGCGPNPLPGCDKYFDKFNWGSQKIDLVDFYTQPLPKLYNVYCRHVLEDMRYPEALLQQFKNCERGWIETPHPCVEYTRGMDNGSPWRGFAHHWWYIWVEDDTLIFCPKSVTGEFFQVLIERTGWNTYYKWKDYNLKWKILQHDVDFDLRKLSYISSLVRGFNA